MQGMDFGQDPRVSRKGAFDVCRVDADQVSRLYRDVPKLVCMEESSVLVVSGIRRLLTFIEAGPGRFSPRTHAGICDVEKVANL